MNEPRPRGPVEARVPEGDTRERLVCDSCGFILYSNPKVMVGSVAVWDSRILLVRRDIEPRSGFWTLPAGFMENGETTRAGALREAFEESGARLEIEHLLAVYDIPRISQVQVIYAARLLAPEIHAGHETREAALFAWEEIPWAELAFPSVRWALVHWKEQRDAGDRIARGNPSGELGDWRPGEPV